MGAAQTHCRRPEVQSIFVVMSEGLRKKYHWIPYMSGMFKKRLRGNMLSYVSRSTEYGVLCSTMVVAVVAGLWQELSQGKVGLVAWHQMSQESKSADATTMDHLSCRLESCRHQHSLLTDNIFMLSNCCTHLVPWNRRPNLAEPDFRPASWAVQRWWQA
jgi:hypothetical protein